MGKSQVSVSYIQLKNPREAEKAVDHSLRNQFLATFIVSLTNFNSGLATNFIYHSSLSLTAGANVVGKFTEYDVTNDIVMLFCAAVISALLMGLVADQYGRKAALYLAAIINTIGGVFMRNGYSGLSMWTAVACATCSIVSGLIVGPMYISEISSKTIRGRLITFCTLQYSLGMLLGYLVGRSYDLSDKLKVLYVVIPVTQMLLYNFIPESPFFLFSKSRIQEAVDSLSWSRAPHRPITEDEMAILIEPPLSTEERTFWQTIKCQSTRKALLSSMGLVFFQRMSGFLMFTSASYNIIQKADNVLSEDDARGVLTGIQIAISLVLLCGIDRVGRKCFLYVSYGGNFITLLVLTIYWMTLKFGLYIGEFNWLPLLCMFSCTVFYNMGAASITTLIPNEVTPVRVKGMMGSIDGVLTSLLVLAIAPCTPLVSRHIGDYLNVLIPTIMNMIALVFTWTVVQETKGKSLLQCSDKSNGLLRNEASCHL